MEMTKEDLIKLLPARESHYWLENKFFKGWMPRIGGPSAANARRVLHDWFPPGMSFTFLGAECMVEKHLVDMPPPSVVVLTPAPGGRIERVTLSFRTCMSLLPTLVNQHIPDLENHDGE